MSRFTEETAYNSPRTEAGHAGAGPDREEKPVTRRTSMALRSLYLRELKLSGGSGERWSVTGHLHRAVGLR